MPARDVVRPQVVVRVEDGIVEHGLEALLAESVGIFLHHVAPQRGVHHIVVGGLRVPDAEAAVVLCRQAAVGHSRRLRGLSPLLAVKLSRIERGGRGLRVGPVGLLERRHVEMDEHAEAQVNEILLQVVQPSCLRGSAMDVRSADHRRLTGN